MSESRGAPIFGAGRRNAIWLREMRQLARLPRTPFVLMGLTVLAALLLCAVGALLAANTSPTTTGVTLYNVYFSMAYYMVVLGGPAIASNMIASEREGRTWEAMQLTRLSPSVIARGKFLAAFTNVATCIIMLAPVGALPFLFGGVSATEVVVAFAWVFACAALTVAFGLAISSKMATARAAIVVTLLVASLIAPVLWLTFGLGLSSAVHELWPQVPELPLWLPTAYVRAPFSWSYIGVLVAAPLLTLGIPGWFLYEATVANLTSITDDKSSGLRRWFIVSSTLLVIAGATLMSLVDGPVWEANTTVLCLFLAFCSFCAFVFAGEPIGPTRRVAARLANRSPLARRLFEPGVMRAASSLVAFTLSGLLALTAVASMRVMAAVRSSGPSRWPASGADGLVLVGGYAACFFLFLVGFAAWARVRFNSPSSARVLLLVVILFALAGPWLAAAMSGALTDGRNEGAALLAAPSPIYAIVVAAMRKNGDTGQGVATLVVVACAIGWALLGSVLLALAGKRARAIVRVHNERLAQSDAFLDLEEARHATTARATEAG